MGTVVDFLRKYLAEYEFDFDDVMIKKFEIYANILIEWNKKINLTSIVEPEQIVIKHFLDSVVTLKYAEIPCGSKLIDVGTGAGFPGIPIKILRPDIDLTLLDSLNKRVNFLIYLLNESEIEAAVIHGRAEDFGRSIEFRENFDVATSRAVARLNVLAEYCLPLVKVSGSFIALKSNNIDEEIEESKSAFKTLGGKINSIKKLNLPKNNPRSIITIKKVSKISDKYPRVNSKIAKNPL